MANYTKGLNACIGFHPRKTRGRDHTIFGEVISSGESVLQERKSPWENKQAVTIDLRLWIHWSVTNMRASEPCESQCEPEREPGESPF